MKRTRNLFLAAVLSAALALSGFIPVSAKTLSAHVESFDSAACTVPVEGTLLLWDGIQGQTAIGEFAEAYGKLPQEVKDLLEFYAAEMYVSSAAYKKGEYGMFNSTAIKTVAVTIPYIPRTNENGVITGVSSMPVIILFSGYDTDADSLLHEVGHYIDVIALLELGVAEEGQYVLFSSSDEWASIWQQEGSAIKSLSISSLESAYEGFAEAFMLYVEQPQKLAALCPQTYAFVEAAVAWTCANMSEFEWLK